MSASFELSEPERVTIGTVGPAGARTFYLQARQVDRLVTLKLEKQQVGALAELLAELLSDLPDPGDAPDPSTMELEEPVLAEWVVGGMQLSYDTSADRIVLLAEEAVLMGSDAPGETDPEGDVTPEGNVTPEGDVTGAGDVTRAGDEPGAGDGEGAIGRLAFTRAQASALIARGAELVTAGRAPCPLCGYPLDPSGHACPKTNGHRAPTL